MGQTMKPTSKRDRLSDCYGAARLFVIVIASVASGCPASSSRPEMPPEAFCEHRLATLQAAMARYRAESGRLPDNVTSAAGFEHSWRAVLAPYLVEGERFPLDYRFDEPWDSSQNRRALRSRVSFRYTCPVEGPQFDYPFVSYVMLVRGGPRDADERRRFATALPDDAVLLVESAGCQIECGEPRDIDIESLFNSDSAFGVGKLNSPHPGVVKALRVDGTVIDIRKDISKEDLRMLLSGSTPNWAE